MAQLEAMKKYVKSSGGTSRHTADQLIHGDDPSLVQHTSPTSAKSNASPTSAKSNASPTSAKSNTSPTSAKSNASPTSAKSNASPTSAKSSDQDEHDRHSKNSVITKVKETAKKLKNTLSKKRHSQDGNLIPASGVILEDHNDKVDDQPEFIGAPMYESELAPENVKETAKQHPREDLGFPQKPVLPTKDNEDPQYHGAPVYVSTQAPGSVKETGKQHPRDDSVISRQDETLEKDNEDPEYYGAPMYESAQAPENVKEMAKQHPREDILISERHDSPSAGSPGKEQEQQHKSNQKITEIPKDEIALLEKVNTGKPTPESKGEKKVTPQEPVQTSKTIAETVTEKLAPAYAMASEATGMITSKIHNIAAATSAALSPKGSPKDDTKGSPKDVSSISDKGVSVKEYLKQKLEPGEDEKALSQMISNSISPTKENTKKEMSKGAAVENLRGSMSSSLAADTSSPNIPVSTNAYEVVEEEHEGRILQAN